MSTNRCICHEGFGMNLSCPQHAPDRQAPALRIDLIADPTLQVEVQAEMGMPGRFKLYIHRGGQTLVRVCKLTRKQFTGVQLPHKRPL